MSWVSRPEPPPREKIHTERAGCSSSGQKGNLERDLGWSLGCGSPAQTAQGGTAWSLGLALGSASTLWEDRLPRTHRAGQAGDEGPGVEGM